MAKRSRKDKTKELAEEIDLHDDMLTSLVEILEEKGILTQEEWEARIRRKTQEARRLVSFRTVDNSS